MILAAKKENIVVEAVSIAILSGAFTVILMEAINRNKPETKTQKQKMTELGVGMTVTIGMYFLTKKIFK